MLGFATLALGAAWILVSLYVVQTAMPQTVVSLPPKSAEKLAFALPQGWSFFTRNPREASAVVYRPGRGAQWVPTSRTPNFQPRNLFGASRVQRAEGIDLGVLAVAVPDKAWVSCRSAASACLARVVGPIQVDIRRAGFLLCGDVGLVSREPVPWAWARDRRRVAMPAKVARLAVSC